MTLHLPSFFLSALLSLFLLTHFCHLYFLPLSPHMSPFLSQCLQRSRSIWPAGPGTPKTWHAAGLQEGKERLTLAHSTHSSTSSGTLTQKHTRQLHCGKHSLWQIMMFLILKNSIFLKCQDLFDGWAKKTFPFFSGITPTNQSIYISHTYLE